MTGAGREKCSRVTSSELNTSGRTRVDLPSVAVGQKPRGGLRQVQIAGHRRVPEVEIVDAGPDGVEDGGGGAEVTLGDEGTDAVGEGGPPGAAPGAEVVDGECLGGGEGPGERAGVGVHGASVGGGTGRGRGYGSPRMQETRRSDPEINCDGFRLCPEGDLNPHVR